MEPARRAYRHLSSIIYLLSSDSRISIKIPLSASQTSPFGKGGHFICGSAAIGILMTLTHNRQLTRAEAPSLGRGSRQGGVS